MTEGRGRGKEGGLKERRKGGGKVTFQTFIAMHPGETLHDKGIT